jgi:hypothetical protein
MVAPEPGEPLLLYITATADVMSMVLVMEQPDPKAEEEPMSQPLEAHPALKHGDGPDTIVECPPLDANLGADNQEVTRSQLSGAISDSGGQEHPKHVPMEVDTPDPPPPAPGGYGPFNDQSTTSAKSSMKPRQGT